MRSSKVEGGWGESYYTLKIRLWFWPYRLQSLVLTLVNMLCFVANRAGLIRLFLETLACKVGLRLASRSLDFRRAPTSPN